MNISEMQKEENALIDKWSLSTITLPEAEKLINYLLGYGILNDAIAEAIHYPDCWDTAAYPSLLLAVAEIGCNPQCCTKRPQDIGGI